MSLRNKVVITGAVLLTIGACNGIVRGMPKAATVAAPVASGVVDSPVSSSSQPAHLMGKVKQHVRFDTVDILVTGVQRAKRISESGAASRGMGSRPHIHIPHPHCHGRCNIPNWASGSSGSSDYAGAVADGEFLIVFVTLTNEGGKFFYGLNDTRLVDNSGREVRPASLAQLYMKGYDGSLAAGQTTKTAFVFDVAKGAQPRRLVLASWSDDRDVQISW